MLEISPKNTTIIMQGAYFKNTNTNTNILAQKIKKKFPEIELILSTWKGTEIEDKFYDKIVFSEDPGVVQGGCNKKPLNINRQIISTLNGIKESSRKYVIKLRTDCCIENEYFFENINKAYIKYNDTIEKHKMVNKKIIISNITSKIPFNGNNILHFSDWFYFGRKEDLYDLFNIELYKKETYPLKNGCFSIAAEQHIILAWLKKHEYKNISLDDIRFHYNVLMNNFILLTFKELSLKSYKNWYTFPFGDNGYNSYTYLDWIFYYNKYFNKNISITFKELLNNVLYKKFYYIKHNMIIKNLIYLKRLFS